MEKSPLNQINLFQFLIHFHKHSGTSCLNSAALPTSHRTKIQTTTRLRLPISCPAPSWLLTPPNPLLAAAAATLLPRAKSPEQLPTFSELLPTTENWMKQR